MNETIEAYLTAKQVAKLLQLAPNTVRRMCSEGDIPAAKLGPQQWRIRSSDLDAALFGSEKR